MAISTLSSSLLVTVIGMVVVFIAMSLFYMSMRLLTKLAQDRAPFEKQTAGSATTAGVQTNTHLQAAAIAIALARNDATEFPLSPFDYDLSPVSPWSDFYRQHQLGSGRHGRMA